MEIELILIHNFFILFLYSLNNNLKCGTFKLNTSKERGKLSMKKNMITFIVGFLCATLIFSSVSVIASVRRDVTATIADFNFLINGEEVEVEGDVLAYDGRTHVQVRGLMEAAGYEVDYDDATRTVILNKKQQVDVNESIIHPKTSQSETGGLDRVIENEEGSLDLDVIKQAIENGEIEVDSIDENGNTLLLLASDKIENYYVGEYLINQGANLNHQNNEGKTAVHIAVIENNQAFLRLLIESGASTIIEDNDGKKPIDYTKEYSTIWGTLKAYVQ